MSLENVPSTSGRNHHATVYYDYNTSKVENDSYSKKSQFFNGNATQVFWWKSKMYSHIMSIDDELWDIIEDGIEIAVDKEGMARDRNSLTEAEKKIYRKHHRVRGSLVEAIPYSKYVKIVNKSSAKTIFESLCSTYEGNQQVTEAKANHLVNQYKLFRMSEYEYIKTMYSRFQLIQSGLQVLKKRYTVSDHVKKILRSHPTRFRTNITAIHEAKDLDTLRLEDLISSLKSHEIELVGDKSAEKSKPLPLIAKDKTSKVLQTAESIEES